VTVTCDDYVPPGEEALALLSELWSVQQQMQLVQELVFFTKMNVRLISVSGPSCLEAFHFGVSSLGEC